MSNNFQPQPQSQSVKPMTDVEKGYLFSGMLHFPDLFASAKDKISTDFFQPDEAQFAIFWRCLLKIAEENNGRLPTEGLPQLVYVSVCSYLESEIKNQHPKIYAEMMVNGGFPVKRL